LNNPGNLAMDFSSVVEMDQSWRLGVMRVQNRKK